ncbi:MAG: Fic family protein [Pseudomonadota bacterium]
MSSFSPNTLKDMKIPVSIGWLLGICMEGKGKQELWYSRKPESLDALRELAIIQSAESSNRIEGVTVSPKRLRPVLLEGARPMDRSEEELVGYRNALDWIHTSHEKIPVTPKTVLRLHEMAQGGFSGDAGKWKARNNEIIEIMPSGERRVRFIPVTPEKVPAAMDQLCLGYSEAWQQDRLAPLLASASFVLDFLCIHPFRDGNGRISRLLTLLLLYHHGYQVGRFISLERIVEQGKETYYEALAASSRGWHEKKHDLIPWWNFFLSTVKQAHGELEKRLEIADTGMGKTDIIRQVVERETGAFALSQIAAKCPSVSTQLIKKVLHDMKEEGLVRLEGRGRGARWRTVDR